MVSCFMINAPSGNTIHLSCHHIIWLTYFIHPKLTHSNPKETIIKVLTELTYISSREISPILHLHYSHQYSHFLATLQCNYKPWERCAEVWAIWPLSSKEIWSRPRQVLQTTAVPAWVLIHPGLWIHTVGWSIGLWRGEQTLSQQAVQVAQIYTLIKPGDVPVNF